MAKNLGLYIFIFLHQTTTHWQSKGIGICCISLYSYIKPQQQVYNLQSQTGCISLYSYIKPQRTPNILLAVSVVYLYIPTSNHNYYYSYCRLFWLYIFIFLHQTTTNSMSMSSQVELYIFIFLHQTTTRIDNLKSGLSLYIFIFLHQTTTVDSHGSIASSCISLYSYIKPQPQNKRNTYTCVVYLYIPTSNHNCGLTRIVYHLVVYLYIPTSNHNWSVCPMRS